MATVTTQTTQPGSPVIDTRFVKDDEVKVKRASDIIDAFNSGQNIFRRQSVTILIDALNSLNAPMPCGHLARYVYPPDGDEGATRYCVLCELEAYRSDFDKLQRIASEW